MSAELFEHLIVGGGPAGLAAAFWELERDPDADVALLEAEDRCGGWVRTQKLDGYTLELGPQTFRPEPGLDAFLRASGLDTSVRACSEAAKRRWIDDGERLHELPGRPGAFVKTRLLGPLDKLRVLWERRVRSTAADDESVADFVGRRFGARGKRLAEAMMHGIYGGDAHALEVASALPAAVELEREHGSLLRAMGAKRKARAKGEQKPPVACSFEGGMQRSVDVLRACVAARVKSGQRVTSVAGGGASAYRVRTASGEEYRARTLCLALPAAAAAHALQGFDAELAAELQGIEAVSVACTYVGFDASALDAARFEGFGFLAPQGVSPVLGAIDCTALFADHAPPGKRLFRVMSGGFAHPSEVERDDAALQEQGCATLRRALGVRGDPDFVHTTRARDAIAQPNRGHARRLERIRARLARHAGLSLRGASYRRVALPAQWMRGGSTP